MPLFARTKEHIDDTSRRYLASAPPGARTEVLTAASTYQVQQLPVARADRFGAPVTVADIAPAVEVVRRNLLQDRDLTGPIARKAMQHLHVIVTDFMSESVGENLDTFLGAIGLEATGGLAIVGGLRDALPAHEVDAAESLANLSLAVFRSFSLGPKGTLPAEYRLYTELHTGAPDKDVEELAYDIIGWVAIGLGRLFNTGRLRPGLPTADPSFRVVPQMEAAGWFPNPQRTGNIVDGDATIQRYWDGVGWTDKVRLREGKTWRTLTASLHAPPTD